MKLFKEFMDFLSEQKIISLALAFVVGVATASLVQALVKDVITPMYSPYLDFLNPEASVSVGKSNFLVGDFIMQAINWVVILLVVFIVGKKLVKSG